MLTTYRRVLGMPGALVFSLSGLVARLPISMVSLGIIVLVSDRTGSYGVAGAVSASFLIANAAMSVLLSRLVDRLGQRRVLPPAMAGFAAALALMVVAVELDWSAPWPHLWAALSGASMPQVGACVRARWSHLVQDRRDLQTAFAFEAVADETVFIAGPTLVTLLSTVVHPVAGLVVAIAAALAGTAVFVSQRRTEPPPGRSLDASTGRGPMPWGVLVPLTVCAGGLGMLFGSSEGVTVAFAEEAGAKWVSGVLLAVWAFGSLLSGAITGAITLRGDHPTRFRWGLLVLGLLMAPMPFVESPWLLGALMFPAGFAISPTLIAAAGWIQQVVPAGRVTEGMTLFTTGLGAGVAAGAAVAGAVIDRAGASAGFWVPVASGLGGAALAFVTAAVVRRRLPRTTPVAGSSPSGSSG